MLKMRIQILKNGGVIGEDVAEFMNKVIDMMAADYPQIGMDPAAMFTTHLAMALERIMGLPVKRCVLYFLHPGVEYPLKIR